MNSVPAWLRALRVSGALLVFAGFQACSVDDSAAPRASCPSGTAGAGPSRGAACMTTRGSAQATVPGEEEPSSLASVLADKGGQYVDGLARNADKLPPEVADMVREFMAFDSFPSAFAEADLQRVRILPGREPGAAQFLRGGQAAITLDLLVIFEDERYDALASWDASWDDVSSGDLSDAQDRALFTLLHELVHVRQFRELGRERFLSEYLADVVSRGEQAVELEEEAYAIAPKEGSWSREAIADAE